MEESTGIDEKKTKVKKGASENRERECYTRTRERWRKKGVS